MFNTHRLLFFHFSLPPKISLICNTRDRTSFCPSKTVVTAVIFVRAIKFQTSWIIIIIIIFVPGRKIFDPALDKAKTIYSPLCLFATRSGIVRMINSTVQFFWTQSTSNSFFNCLWLLSCLNFPSPGTRVLGKIITLSSLSSSSSSSSNMSSTTCRQKQRKSFSCFFKRDHFVLSFEPFGNENFINIWNRGTERESLI